MVGDCSTVVVMEVVVGCRVLGVEGAGVEVEDVGRSVLVAVVGRSVLAEVVGAGV